MRNGDACSTFQRRAGRFRESAVIMAVLAACAFSQGPAISGYAEELPFITFPSGERSMIHGDNLLQCRLNTIWRPWSPFTIAAAGRMLWYGGRDFRDADAVAAELGNDPGYGDLTLAQGTDARSSVFYENIDRLFAEYTKGNLSVTAGRQRINWGTNLVWNPNDWFNAFNYLDFSYPEHPGTDAVRVQYYPDATSVAELALAPGRTRGDRTFAALYKLNKWAYDWQFQTGLSGSDAAAGFSWSGAVKGAGFRGEVAAYYPAINRGADDSLTLVSSVSADYTFPSSLFFQGSVLYNGFGASGGSPLTAQSGVTAKTMIPARFALFGETAFQLSPLVRPDFAALANPADGSFCLVPSVTISLLNNVDLYALGQIFVGRQGDLFGSAPDVVTVSVKWSF